MSLATTSDMPKENRLSQRLSRWTEHFEHLGIGSNNSNPRQSDLPLHSRSPVPSSHYSERHSFETNADTLQVTEPLDSNPYDLPLQRPDNAVLTK